MGKASERSERFVRHLEPLQGALEAFCRRTLMNAADVEDVLQSAVLQAYRDFHLYVENTNFRAWIFKFVRLEAANCNRRQQRAALALPEGEPAAETITETMTADPAYRRLLDEPEFVLEQCDEHLAAALRQLPEVQREVLLLRALGEFKYREVADILEIPVGSVMGQLSRARAALRHRLSECARSRSPGSR